jgi:hypothetical protein
MSQMCFGVMPLFRQTPQLYSIGMNEYGTLEAGIITQGALKVSS